MHGVVLHTLTYYDIPYDSGYIHGRVLLLLTRLNKEHMGCSWEHNLGSRMTYVCIYTLCFACMISLACGHIYDFADFSTYLQFRWHMARSMILRACGHIYDFMGFSVISTTSRAFQPYLRFQGRIAMI